MNDRSHLTANAEATAALRALVSPLGEAELTADLGAGWTVAMALAHVAFWDAWHLARWHHAAATGDVSPGLVTDEDEEDRLNEALEATWRVLAPGRAAALALETADAVDAVIAGLSDASVDAARAGGGARWVDRSAHRLEHVEQIRRALGRP